MRFSRSSHRVIICLSRWGLYVVSDVGNVILQNYGHFTGVIDSTPSHAFVKGNGMLELNKNDELGAIYTDTYPPGDVTKLLNILETPFRGVLSVSPAAQLLPDGVLSVTVVDYDLDDDVIGNGDTESDWSEAMSSVVTVKSYLTLRNGTAEICEATGHSERLTLVETSDAGTFTGAIQVSVY